MDHPNIAKVLDAGVENGIPFFVMELVEGVPITTFCDARRLTPRERLELFVPVCNAIQHAHQKGIIHRDVKPSNVLVAEYDGRPVPKVIDFGVAKAVGVKLTDNTVHTCLGAMVGTLEYMAPEQAAFDACDVDTRADVYALGVLLYELLTGRTPIRREEFRVAGVLEMLRVIREVAPPWPSHALAAAADLPALATARATEPRRLPVLFRGEVDWVVMKCLEKDRSRRYETASGLARDLQRYLADELVEARPTSAWYSLRKFVRRHRTVLTTAAAFVLLLFGAIAVSVWQAVRATAAEEKALTERNQKEDARRRARQALNKLTDEVVERLMAHQVRLTEEDRAFLRQVLALHEEFARAEGDSPERRAGVADAQFRVGLIRSRLGEFAEAEHAYRAAIGRFQELANEFQDRPDYRRDLAKSYNKLAPLLRKTRRPRQAQEAYNTAIGILRKLTDEFRDQSDYHSELNSSPRGRQ
jgi:tetratricopeptide (TPR) repeat protein